MEKIYLKPLSVIVNLDAEQMIATSGSINDVPMHGADSYSSNRKGFPWNEDLYGDGENTIWK